MAQSLDLSANLILQALEALSSFSLSTLLLCDSKRDILIRVPEIANDNRKYLKQTPGKTSETVRNVVEEHIWYLCLWKPIFWGCKWGFN